jgi:hypothetical protein
MLCVCVCWSWTRRCLTLLRTVDDEEWRTSGKSCNSDAHTYAGEQQQQQQPFMLYGILVVIVMIYSLVLVVSDVWRRFRVIRTRPKTTMNPVYWMGRIRIRVSPRQLWMYTSSALICTTSCMTWCFHLLTIPRVVVTISNLFAQPVQVTAAMEKSESRNLGVFFNNLRVYIRRSVLYGFR